MPLLQERIFPNIRTYAGYLLTVVGAGGVIICAYEPSWWEGMVGGALVQGVGMFILGRRGRLSLPLVLAVALLARLLLLPLPPLLSDDAYRYIWDGLLQLEGVNPYLFRPSAAALAWFQDLWIYPLLNSADYYTVYPPVSQFVYAFGALFHRPDSLGGFYAVKAVILAADLGAVYVISRFVSADHLIWYAWHPLVWLEFAGQAHQEALMIFFLIVCWVLLKGGRGRSAVMMLTLAGWVKLYPFLLLPFLLRRTRWRYLWVVAAVSAIVWVPYADPQVARNMLNSLELYVQLFEFNAGPYYGAKYLMYLWTGVDWSKTLGPLFAGIFGCAWASFLLVDWRWQWRWPTVVVAVLGTYLAFSTTVHPWYLTGVLAFIPLLQKRNYAWSWLAFWSLATYLFYQGGPYWSFIWIGWSGWALLLLVRRLPALLDSILQERGRWKWRRLAPRIPADTESILDLGAGEGYVGRSAAEELDAEVFLADLMDLNRTDLPYVTFDGSTLPVSYSRFDTTLLVYVLHHAENPERLLREAARVTGGRLVILESVYDHPIDRWTLTMLDHLANSLRFLRDRSGVHRVEVRTVEEWTAVLEGIGEVSHTERLGRFPHKQALFVVDLNESRDRSAD